MIYDNFSLHQISNCQVFFIHGNVFIEKCVSDLISLSQKHYEHPNDANLMDDVQFIFTELAMLQSNNGSI